MQWVADQCKAVDEQIIAKASEHQNSLTKPPGSLGMLGKCYTSCRREHWLLSGLCSRD